MRLRTPGFQPWPGTVFAWRPRPSSVAGRCGTQALRPVRPPPPRRLGRRRPPTSTRPPPARVPSSRIHDPTSWHREHPDGSVTYHRRHQRPLAGEGGA